MSARQKKHDEWIYAEVFRAILEQRLNPGVKLTESALCDVFKVSRTTIRRVLLRLSLDKVVEIRPNRGAVIATPKAEDVRQIFEARRLLEDGIIAETAAKCSTADSGTLREIVKQENSCIANGDRSCAIRLSGDFHMELARIGGNAPLMELLRQLVAQTSLAIALYESPGHLLCVEDHHIEIVVAVEDGDVARSRALMKEHLIQCEKQLRLDPRDNPNNLKEVFADVMEARRSA